LNPSSFAFYPILEEQVGSWSEHVTSWINSGQRLHFIRYEDLKSQPFETFSKALNFLGLKFSNETIEKAIAASKIQKLQDLERLYGFKEKLQGSTAFFRNGEAGDWKNKLTKNQIAKIIQDHQKVMIAYQNHVVL